MTPPRQRLTQARMQRALDAGPDHPIRTVIGPGATLSQGPTVEPADPRDPAHVKPDMHGKVAVRTGEHTIAVGRPVPRKTQTPASG